MIIEKIDQFDWFEVKRKEKTMVWNLQEKIVYEMSGKSTLQFSIKSIKISEEV